MAGEARRVESTHTAGPPAPEEALLRTKQRRAGAQPLWVNLREEDASADGALRLMSRSFGQSFDNVTIVAQPDGAGRAAAECSGTSTGAGTGTSVSSRVGRHRRSGRTNTSRAAGAGHASGCPRVDRVTRPPPWRGQQVRRASAAWWRPRWLGVSVSAAVRKTALPA